MTSRTIRIALAASLLGNVFAAGVLGGGLWILQRPGGPQSNRAGQQRPIRAAGDALPAGDRQRFQDVILQVLRDGRDLRQTAVASRRQAAALFARPDFDKAAAADLLAQGRTADTTLQGRLDNAAIDFAATLPPDERATLARGLERGGPLRHPQR